MVPLSSPSAAAYSHMITTHLRQQENEVRGRTNFLHSFTLCRRTKKKQQQEEEKSSMASFCISSTCYSAPCTRFGFTLGLSARQTRTKLLALSKHKANLVTATDQRKQRSSKVSLDPDLHAVLELASDSELYELSKILYGRSLLSPLLKSYMPRRDSSEGCEHDPEEREALLERLVSRFLYLGANAQATLRGRRPRYRDVLLCVHAKLKVSCSTRLSTEDLEAEIFLHLLQRYSRNNANSSLQSSWTHQNTMFAATIDDRTQNSESWRSAITLGGEEMLKVIVKGGSIFTISALQKMAAKRLGGKLLVETARYQFLKEVLKEGGKGAALSLQVRVAVLAARQGLLGAASCYRALKTTSMLMGPLLWGTFLAEVVIKSLGVDYARVVRAIYLVAQIRLLRTYGWTRAKHM